MSETEEFQYVRTLDQDVIDAANGGRYSIRLYDRDNGAKHCTLRYIHTPAGGGSPEGTHTHKVDQIFYLLSGTMFIEIDGVESKVEPNSAIVFPAGVPHRNWNEEATVHLAILAPLPPE